MCRDMYDEHPGLAYFYVDAHRRVPIPHHLTLADAKSAAEAAWAKLRAAAAAEDEFEEYDGQFSPGRMLLLASDRTVLQCFEGDSWVSEFDAPEQWAALLEQAGELDAEASFEAGWDNFSTAEGLRARATALRRRVSIAQAHFGALPAPPAPAKRRARGMRGLDERVALALARVLRISHPEKAEYDLMEVMMDAEALGRRDYHAGLTEPPVMFADEPLLLKAWEAGQDGAAELDEMEHCAGCNNPELPLCPFHD